jgi:hypothetical protein
MTRISHFVSVSLFSYPAVLPLSESSHEIGKALSGMMNWITGAEPEEPVEEKDVDETIRKEEAEGSKDDGSKEEDVEA